MIPVAVGPEVILSLFSSTNTYAPDEIYASILIIIKLIAPAISIWRALMHLHRTG